MKLENMASWMSVIILHQAWRIKARRNLKGRLSAGWTARDENCQSVIGRWASAQRDPRPIVRAGSKVTCYGNEEVEQTQTPFFPTKIKGYENNF